MSLSALLRRLTGRDEASSPSRQAAFTVIEMLLAVVLIGILGGFVLAQIGGAKEKAYVDAMKNDLRNFATEQEIYLEENDTYADGVAAISGFQLTEDVLQTNSYADGENWMLMVGHEKTDRECVLSRGADDDNTHEILCEGEDGVGQIAISDDSPDAGEDVTLDATGSFAAALELPGLQAAMAAGSISQVEWRLGDGTVVVGSPAEKLQINHAFPNTDTEYGILVIATMTDGSHQHAVGSVRTTGTQAPVGPNSAPVASFTASPNPAQVDSAVSFDGSGSTDPDGQVVGYSWDFDGDGVEDATGETASHAYSTTGFFDAVLTVTDDRGGTSSDTVAVSVEGENVTLLEDETSSGGHSGGVGEKTNFLFEVPSYTPAGPNESDAMLTIRATGTGSDCCDKYMYAKQGAEPTFSDFDCTAELGGPHCIIEDPTPGEWYAFLGSDNNSYSDAAIEYDFQPPQPIAELSDETPSTSFSGGAGTQKDFHFTVPSYATGDSVSEAKLTVDGNWTPGNHSNDVYIHVRQGVKAEWSTFACDADLGDVCSFTAPTPGDWYVMFGHRDYGYSNATVTYDFVEPKPHIELTSGTVSSGHSGAINETQGFTFEIPAYDTTAGDATLTVEWVGHGAVGDRFHKYYLWVQPGSMPGIHNLGVDGKALAPKELTRTWTNPAEGTWYMLLGDSHNSYTDVSLKYTFTPPQ